MKPLGFAPPTETTTGHSGNGTSPRTTQVVPRTRSRRLGKAQGSHRRVHPHGYARSSRRKGLADALPVSDEEGHREAGRVRHRSRELGSAGARRRRLEAFDACRDRRSVARHPGSGDLPTHDAVGNSQRNFARGARTQRPGFSPDGHVLAIYARRVPRSSRASVYSQAARVAEGTWRIG